MPQGPFEWVVDTGGVESIEGEPQVFEPRLRAKVHLERYLTPFIKLD